MNDIVLNRSLTSRLIETEALYGAGNYKPLDVVLTRGEGVHVWDVDGARYLDCLSAYSAVNQGHCHPRILEAMVKQAGRLTLTSRAFRNDQLAPFYEELCALTDSHKALPMNSGAEAVESAVKLARKWAYQVKGVPEGRAEIIVAGSNFHGRTTTIVSFSTDETARADFGPFTPGFVTVKYGDAAARSICDQAGVLLIADEIQSGLGRAGRRFACDHEAVRPDLYLLGKALGGGIVPVSAVVGNEDVLGVLRPGEHGSTFGGNPLACAVGREVLRLLADGRLVEESAALGDAAASRLRAAAHPAVREVRQRGLWLGIELSDDAPSARRASERLMERGVLAKDTHGRTLRLAPPLTVTAAEFEWALERLDEVLAGLL